MNMEFLLMRLLSVSVRGKRLGKLRKQRLPRFKPIIAKAK
jgi:hypothetical protein